MRLDTSGLEGHISGDAAIAASNDAVLVAATMELGVVWLADPAQGTST